MTKMKEKIDQLFRHFRHFTLITFCAFGLMLSYSRVGEVSTRTQERRHKMGSSSGSDIEVPTVEKTVTPAVARTVEADTAKAQQTQAEARARRSGISSTYNRFAAASSDGGKNGSAAKLG